MESYLIILKKKNDYHSGEYKKLWLPTTESEIEKALYNLGCRLVLPDYEVAYSEFGYPEIDRMACDSDILALNCLAKLLQDFTGTPGELCAELVYKDCKNVYDVIVHLTNRPQLVVLESYKDIIDYGRVCLYIDFLEWGLYERMNFEEYEDELYYDDSFPLWQQYIVSAMHRLRYSKYRFTPYGLVYEEHQAPEDFDDIELPF